MQRNYLLLAILIATCSPQALTFGQVDLRFTPTGPADYNVATNWNFFGLMTVPNGASNEFGIIESGGTAQVSNTPNSPGSLQLGTIVGAGHLEIQSGGNLSTDATGANVDGSIIVGSGGAGTLNVLPGGTLTTVGPLTVNAGAGTSATFGAAAGAGNANVTAAAAAFNGAVTAFPNANFLSNSSLTFNAASSAYTAQINGINAATLNATGAATLGGSFTASFAAQPSPGTSWAVVEADSINGSFGSLNANVSLPSGQNLYFTTEQLGGGGERLNLNLNEVLVLEVNRNDGSATIRQPGTTTISLDGYSILSSQGTLQVGGWNSFADQGALGGGWTESNPNANALSELKSQGSGSLSTGQSVPVGSVYDPFAVPFGFTGDDLTFEYTDPVSGQTFPGIVELTGTLVNNMVLQIDPSNGQARIRNSSGTSVNLDAYTIESASGSITAGAWSSLQDQGTAGGDWLELFNPPDNNMIGELTTTFAAMGPGSDKAFGIGTVFNTGGARDLVFQYKQDGDQFASLGTVVYQEIVDNPADVDFDGRVNGADFLAIQRTNPAQISTWESNFGFVEGVSGSPATAVNASAVPEPTAAALAGLLIAVSSLFSIRVR